MTDICSYIESQPFFVSKKGVDELQISNAEKMLGCKFSSEYIEYLLKCGSASFDGHELTGICDTKRLNVVDVTIDNREYYCPLDKSFYVVEEANIDDIVIWQNESGIVYQTQPGHLPVVIADSLLNYLKLNV